MSQPPTAQGDSRLMVERIARGDRAAEEELARIYLPRVHSFVGARTGNRDLALDVGQETILAVVCAAREGKIRDPGSLPAFVLGAARNIMNDALRRRTQEKLEPITTDFPEPAAAPVTAEAERMREAHRAIDQLEPSDRLILLLTLVDGLKPGAIAAQSGLSSMVVRQRKRRALKRVIEMLKPGVTKSLSPPTSISRTGETGQ